MVADFSVLPGLSGDLLPGHAALTLQFLLVLKDPQSNILPLQPTASTLHGGKQP